MADLAPILSIEHASIDESSGHDIGLRDLTLTMGTGDVALILLQRPYFNIPLADLASGLLSPTSGTVKFRGRDWQGMLPTRAGQERGRIGRVFHGRAWVSNQNVDENLLLPGRYHSDRVETELTAEAEVLAKRFGLAGLPETRPAATPPLDLHRAAAVRAFLREPSLLLLERPEHGIFPEIMPPLLEAIAAARQRGAAVLWLTSLPEVFHDPQINPTARYEMDGNLLRRLVPSPGTPGEG